MATKDIGDLIAGFAPEGPLRTAVYVVYGLCTALAGLCFKYYLGLLAQGAKPEGSIERQDYDRLRASLAGDTFAARLYAKWLTKFLDWIERFFGDVGMADRTLFPHAFGLKTPAPLWTAPAFDRCLLLALIYPIAAILLIWAVTGRGDVDSSSLGVISSGLGLTSMADGWTRGLFVASVVFFVFATRRSFRANRWRRWLWALSGLGALAVVFVDALFSGSVSTHAFTVAVAIAGAFAGASVGACTGAVAFVISLSFTVVFAYTGSYVENKISDIISVPVNFIADKVLVLFLSPPEVFAIFAIGLYLIFAVSYIFSFAVAFAGAVAISIPIALLNQRAIERGSQGRFLALFLGAMITACFAAAFLLVPSKAWNLAGSLLLFQGLLTLLNAPFDWFSLGVTRALLRRGLELGGLWPYILALVDACLTGVIIAALALTMVLFVQVYESLAFHAMAFFLSDAERQAINVGLLDPNLLLTGIKADAAAPEYWWAYALLLWTMIPSLINLAIGGMALTRGVPGVSRLLLHWIPEGRDVPDYRRPLAALVLTGQMFTGAVLGIAAQALLAWGVIFHVLPWVGLDLLEMARAVAGFDIFHVGS